MSELRLAWRVLTRRKAFLALVVTVLSAGLGPAIAGFAVLDALQFRPLPFTQPGALVQVGLAHESRPREVESIFRQDALAIAGRNDVFAGVAAFTTGAANLSDGVRAERYESAAITADLFPLLGLQPVRGRNFSMADSAPGAPAVVLISDELWRTRYHARADIVGLLIRVNSEPAMVVGIMPPGFAFPHRQRLWLPLPNALPGEVGDASRAILVARLASGISIHAAAAALAPMLDDARGTHPDRYQGYGLRVQPFSWFFVDSQARASQRLLLVAVLALMALAVANAGGLMVAQARARADEWALRAALGAPPGDTLRSTLAAGVIVSAASLLLSLIFARGALAWLAGELPRSEDPMPYFVQFSLGGFTALFATASAALAATVTGVIPGWRSAGPTIASSGFARTTGSRAAARFSAGLVSMQVALSVVILLSMSIILLAVDSFGGRDVGAITKGLMTARIALPEDGRALTRDRALFWTELAARLRNEPGVLSVTVGTAVPGSLGQMRPVRIEGAEPGRDIHRVSVGAVDPDFLETYGIHLVDGRGLTPHDTRDRPLVALVDSRFADAAWRGENPLGRRMQLEGAGSLLVVGVTRNLHLAQVDDPPRGTLLVPLLQHAPRFATVAVRTAGDPYAVAPAMRAAVTALDADVPLYWVQSLDDAIRHGFYNVRIFARIIAWLGLSALLVTAAGLYALLAARVQQRTREIGIRRALGARTTAIARTVLSQVALPLSLGVLTGILAAWPVSLALVSLEPEVISAGTASYGLALGTLLAAATLAVTVPTARALIISPLVALREQGSSD